MKKLDVTFDLETCSLCPTAAVMSIVAVAWDRDGKDSPFFPDEFVTDIDSTFSAHIDLRRMFVDGFTFDQDTANWWARQSEVAKDSVLADDDADMPCRDIKCAVKDLFIWIKDFADKKGYETVNLWCQGSDFDIAILRNICCKYDIPFPIKHTNFRDHRTFFLETARMFCEISGSEFNEKEAYKMVDAYEGTGAPHDPLFDCKRSIYSTWQMMNHKRCLGVRP